MLISVKTTKLNESENGIKGLATVSFGDAFKVQSISIMEGKNGLFVSMPAYKSKQTDEQGNPVYKEICNPITKDFRDNLYGAILSSYNNEREATIGDADDRKKPNIGIKVTPINNGGNTVGLARVYLEDAFVVSNIAIKKTTEGKMFAAMPSFKTSQVDENGKPVYKDICYPATKEFRQELQKSVVNAYLEATVGIDQPNHAKAPAKDSYEQAVEAGFVPESKSDEELPFDAGLQDPKEIKPAKSEAQRAESKKTTKPKAEANEKPKSIKDRLAAGEAKKAAVTAAKEVVSKTAKNKEAVIA